MLLEETCWVNYLVLTKTYQTITRQALPDYLEHSLTAYPLILQKKAMICYWLGCMYEETSDYAKALEFFQKSETFYRGSLLVDNKNQSKKDKRESLVILFKLVQVVQETKKTIAFSKLMRDKSHDISVSKVLRKAPIEELITLCSFDSNAVTEVSLVEIGTGDIFAVRIQCIKKVMFRRDKIKLLQEYQIMKKLSRHDQFLKPIDFIEEDNSCSLYMEYGGIAINKYPEYLAYFNDLFLQTVLGVAYMHAQGLVHGDLRSCNVVVKKNNLGAHQVKIIDFGSTENNSNYYNNLINPLYSSIELHNGRTKVLASIDVWSLGVMFFELKYGCLPFKKMPSFPNRALSMTGNIVRSSRMIGKYFMRPKKQLSLYEKDYIEEFAVIADKSKLSSLFYKMMHPKEEKRPEIKDVVLSLQQIIASSVDDIAQSPTRKSSFSDLDVRLTHSSGISTSSSLVSAEDGRVAPISRIYSKAVASFRTCVYLTR